MNRTYRKPKFGTLIAPGQPLLAEASASAMAHASPARVLQSDLAHRFAQDGRRWSPRQTLGFILLTCGGFWAVVALAFVSAR